MYKSVIVHTYSQSDVRVLECQVTIIVEREKNAFDLPPSEIPVVSNSTLLF